MPPTAGGAILEAGRGRWTSWVVGAIAVALGGSSAMGSNRMRRQAIQP
jgi:hypothetical protein